MKVALIQMDSTENINQNMEKASKFIMQAVKQNVDTICLPENFLYAGGKVDKSFEIESADIKVFRELANINNVNIILGSIKIKEKGEDKPTNTTLVLNRNGEVIHRYDKIYMYTVNRHDLQIDESKNTKRGQKAGIFELEGIKVGIGICFDIRFPEYFRELTLQGAELIFLPANFRKTTGLLAWEHLTKARAIENQVYFCACCQTGGTELKQRCGNSSIISYKGEVLSNIEIEEGIIITDINIEELRQYRREIPALEQAIEIKKEL